MNAEKEIKELISDQKCKSGSFFYNVERSLKNKCIVKDISVTDKGKKHLFSERVQAYQQSDLENFFLRNQLEVVHLLGDYNLSPFDKTKSERLILIGRKK